jgi:type II secretory ATPase GspE/PulE/Tfp pilus assembly ATPase PilB-like protein
MSDTEPAGQIFIQLDPSASADAIVPQLLEHAAGLGASDLFLVANEDHLLVQVRHLGVIRDVATLRADPGRRCVAHIKAVAGMDIAEKRRPLDGRWIFETAAGTTLDVRVNTLPTLYGEDVTLRLLARDSPLLGLDGLGLLLKDYNQLLSLLNAPSGLILVTGPTGAGKTTTLYACLNHLNNGERKINTIEDPIEYSLLGVRQSQVNPRLDVGFAELLRGVLRQAPDIIMIGEIRDQVTAETAVRAANSGHLVLATLHAPVAAGAVESMLTLGTHPHFLASSFLGAIAQRLVRTLCPACKQSFDVSASPQTFDEVRPWLEPGQGETLYGPGGCPDCRMLGYTGRTGVFEILPTSPEIRKLILTRQPVQVIRAKGIEEGMIEFRQAALLKVARGETSIEEVFRVVPAEYLASQV